MVNVLLVCSLGASTGELCSRIKKQAEKEGFELHIWANSLASVDDQISKADIILLAPQVKFMLKKVAAKAGDRPIDSIDMRAYGMMDAEAVLDQIKTMSSPLHMK